MVSEESGGSVKKQALEPFVKVRPWLRTPFVVDRPFTTEHSPSGGVAGPKSLRKSVEPPNPLVRGDPRPRVPITNSDDGENERAPIPTLQSAADDQSVASDTILGEFGVGPTPVY